MKKTVGYILKTLLVLLLILIFFSGYMYLSTNGDYTIAKTVEHNRSLPSQKINNITFHLETFGDKNNDVLIILHGGPGGDYQYLLDLKALSDTYFVVFYDQRGSGLSSRVTVEEQSLANSIDDLANIIQYYSPKKQVNIVGHSWGAMLATAYVAKYGSKVNKLVLAEPGMLTSKEAKEFQEKVKLEPSFALIQNMIRFSFESLHLKEVQTQDRIDYIFGKIVNLDMEGNPILKYFCDEKMENGHTDFWRFGSIANQGIIEKGLDENGIMQIDLVSGLENFDNEVLFISSECNKITGTQLQKRQMQYFKKAKLIEIKNTGHTMIGEKPRESLDVIREYLN